MTDSILPNDDDDITYEWTLAQASISKAFKEGRIDLRIKEPDGITIYRPKYICFTSHGNITIVADNASVEYI